MIANKSANENSLYSEKRREKINKNEKYKDEKKWYEYLIVKYPLWHSRYYANKSLIKIIYYNENVYVGKPEIICYPIYLYETFTIKKILIYFKHFLKNQRIAIKMCFGDDLISELITKHLPGDFDMETNYIYMHKYDKKTCNKSYVRYCVPENKTIKQLNNELNYQISEKYPLTLRIRRDPMNKNCEKFTKTYNR
jgi:hypothetical protein